MTFEDWIEMVEDGAVEGPDLMHASLEHRGALRKAFEAGRKAGKKQRADDEWAEDVS